MARTKKNRIFDLFKSDFKITFFYKPSMIDGDDYYFLVLDDIIRLKIKEVNGAVIIDDVIPITSTYISPIYETMVRCIMRQSNVTVLVAMTGNASVIQQACINCNAPIVDDERYITVSLGYYNKLKATYGNDMTKYGFYILSVSDEDETGEYQNASGGTQKSVNQTPIGVEPPISKVSKLLTKALKPVFKGFAIEQFSTDSIRCLLTKDEYFSVEVAEGGIYIKELLQTRDTSLNLIKIMELVQAFQTLASINQNVYILSIQNAELNSLCAAKGFINIREEQQLPVNRLFKQAFHGYGTYQIV